MHTMNITHMCTSKVSLPETVKYLTYFPFAYSDRFCFWLKYTCIYNCTTLYTVVLPPTFFYSLCLCERKKKIYTVQENKKRCIDDRLLKYSFIPHVYIISLNRYQSMALRYINDK